MLNKLHQTFLLHLARQAIREYLKTGKKPVVVESELAAELKTERATFVTLTIGGDLRGCIGSLQAHRPLYLDVINNACSAAFGDPRFPPLDSAELEKIKIEISILTPPQLLDYEDSEDLLKKLRPGVDGVILGDGFLSATYLPQVWEDLPDKAEFLSSLCMKAGLARDTWEKKKLKVELYQVEKFEE